MARAATAKKQQEIPGAERESNAEVDALVATLRKHRSKRMDEQKREETAMIALRDKMVEQGLLTYDWWDGEERYVAELKQKDARISLKKAEDE